MKRNDFILIGIIFIVAVLIFGVQYLTPIDTNAKVEITIDGELYNSFLLSEEQSVDIEGTNELLIENGTARMTAASCPDQLCVHQKAISKNRESIICLPNKVVVSVVGGEENDLDAVTN